MKWLTYDLESTFLQKGYKRGDTLILEIALFKGKREAYQSLVNPVGAVTDGVTLPRRLRTTKAIPRKDHQLLDQASDQSGQHRHNGNRSKRKAAVTNCWETTFKPRKTSSRSHLRGARTHVIAPVMTSFDSEDHPRQHQRWTYPRCPFRRFLPYSKINKDCVTCSHLCWYKVSFQVHMPKIPVPPA